MKKIVIGITGGFGTGKTTVARIFERLGAKVIIADKIAHEVFSPGRAIYKKVLSIFGKSILNKSGAIDRKRLGRIVFNDKNKLLLLNSIVHPEVIERINYLITKKTRGVYIIDAPLIIEVGLLDKIDKLIVVTASRRNQIKRCKKKFNLKKTEILKRIRSQMPIKKKRRLADFIIDNNGSIDKTQRRVKEIWREIKDGTRIKT